MYSNTDNLENMTTKQQEHGQIKEILGMGLDQWQNVEFKTETLDGKEWSLKINVDYL